MIKIQDLKAIRVNIHYLKITLELLLRKHLITQTNYCTLQTQNSCLPRDEEQKQFQNIWRPKSLPNVVYKIALRCIANTIEPFFDKIINKDQTQRKVYRNKYQYENSIFFLNLLMTLLLFLKVHLKTLDPVLKSL